MPQPQSAATKANGIEPLEPKAGLLEMIQVVENKKRNLEKRKQKLEALQARGDDHLTEQQKEAVTHIGEVNGNIQYVEEILVRFREIQLQVDRWISIEAKKEKANQRSKKSAKKNEEGAAQGDGTANNDVQNEVSAEATPLSRNSISDTAAISGAKENEAPAQNLTEEAADSSPKSAVEEALPQPTTDTPPASDERVEDVAAPQNDDAAPVDGDGAAVPLKETITFVNTEANSVNAQGDSQRAQSGFGGRPNHSGPRRDFRQHFDGPRGGYGYGQYGRGQRRGGRGPYRGSGGPRGAPRGAPPASANNGTNEFRGG